MNARAHLDIYQLSFLTSVKVATIFLFKYFSWVEEMVGLQRFIAASGI